MRERCQFDSIFRALSTWRYPGDRLCLVLDYLSELPLPSVSVKKISSLEDSNLFQCKRKLGDGHITAAIKVLSSSGVRPFSPDTLLALESKHPLAPLRRHLIYLARRALSS